MASRELLKVFYGVLLSSSNNRIKEKYNTVIKSEAQKLLPDSETLKPFKSGEFLKQR